MTPPRSYSLTLRLTLLFALASAFVLFLLGLLIGNAVERHFEEQDMEVLTGKMQLAKHILERNPGSQLKETLTQQLDDALTGHHGLIVAVNDQNSIRRGLEHEPECVLAAHADGAHEAPQAATRT